MAYRPKRLFGWFLFLSIYLYTTSVDALALRSTVSRQSAVSRLHGRRSSDPCATLFEENDTFFFESSDVRACTNTVPFNRTVATQFLNYYMDTINFQSTISYIKQPPTSYQQPPVDLFDGLDQIQSAIDSNLFSNEYAFEAAVQRLLYNAHDGHLSLEAGLMSIFSFGNQYALSSVSADGVELPKPYLTDHLSTAKRAGDISAASPIVEINALDAVVWLTQFASENSFGLLDPNADWNALMQSPAGDIQFKPTTLTGGTPFIPGNKTLNYKLANGTLIESQWLAIVDISADFPSIRNGQELYDSAVLGIYPDEDDSDGEDSADDSPSASAVANATAAASNIASPTSTDEATDTPEPTSTPTPSNWFEVAQVPGYPNDPIVKQPNLGDGVSILAGQAVHTFSTTIGKFIQQSKAAGKAKVVIDLQQNAGGNSLLAVDAFKQFFPSIDPFGGSRLRDTSVVDALGNTFTQHWINSQGSMSEEESDALTDLPWAILDYTDADTGSTFTSWPEFFGPHMDHSDLFSTVQRDNLSNILFDKIASGGFYETSYVPSGITIYGYGNRSASTPQPWAAEDILILTDGMCESSCALFVEMMHHEAGVATVVVGGRPNTGPMQAVAGTRGARSYSVTDLDNDMFQAISFNESIESALPSSHLNYLEFWITSAGINLRDQIRKGENVPLQFTYEAASCRIYWTFDNFDDFSRLWQDAADALWSKTGMSCVPDSTIFASNKDTDTVGPTKEQIEKWGGYGSPSPAPLLPLANGNASLPPTSTSLPLPSSVNLPVKQSPDGQPYFTASATPVEYQPLVDISAIVSADPASFDDPESNIANDGDTPRSPTLEKACHLGTNLLVGQENKKCDRNEKCMQVEACVQGKWKAETVCKLRCTETRECPNSGFPVCNTRDEECTTSKGVRTCKTRTAKASFKGSCGKTHTNLPNSACKPSNEGFCESLLKKSDPKCATLQASQVPAGEDVVVEVQLTQDQQDDLLFGPEEDVAAVPGSGAGKSVAEFIARPWS